MTWPLGMNYSRICTKMILIIHAGVGDTFIETAFGLAGGFLAWQW